MENAYYKIPALRFVGFTDAWEQRKLSELIIEYKETVDSDCTLPILTSSKTEGVVLQEEHFGRVQNHDITGYNILPRNYCTYRNRSDGVDFTFNINRCCDKGIISKFYPVFYGNNSDIFFISMVLNYCDEVVHEIAYTCTGTGQKVLSFLDLQKMNIRVPSYDEQKKISQYFEQLDNLITLHQCKYFKDHNSSFAGKIIPVALWFTVAWEQRKLSEIAEKVTQKNTEMKYKETLTNSAEHGIINQTDFFDKEISNADKIDGYYIVDHDDFVYNPRISSLAPVGPINRNKLNRSGVMSPLYTVFRTHDINTLYLEWFFKSDTWHSFMKFNGDSGARSDRFSIRNDLFFTMPISVPSKEEQSFIGAFFERVDATITLHQRKFECLQIFKKSMLQKMFPVDDHNVPQIRFGGNRGAWQKYCLGDLYTERKEQGNEELQILSVSIHSGVSDEELDEGKLGKRVRRSEDKSTYKHVYPGDLVFNMMRAWQGAIGVVKCEGMISPAYISAVPNEIVFPPFMDYVLRRNESISHINDLSYGVTDFRKRLYWDSFVKVTCKLPSIDEQQQIWNYLKTIDDMIFLNLHEIKHLKGIKKALLQKMLI